MSTRSKSLPLINWRWVTRMGFFSTGVILLAAMAWVVACSWQVATLFTHPGCLGERASLESLGIASEPVAFDTSGGYRLRGWFARGEKHPDIAVIVLQGGWSNTEYALADAALLAQAGYSTLIYEHRSCADPALPHSGGYFEAGDLVSAVRYLQARGDIRRTGVLGFSASGSAALLAAAREPGIQAVVAEGGYASLTGDALSDNPVRQPVEWLNRRLVYKFIGVQLGVAPERISPVSRIAAISPRPVLLIYGESESWHGQKLYAAALEPKALWIVPGAGHGGYQQAEPDAYRVRIIEFFDQAFSDGDTVTDRTRTSADKRGY